MMHLFCHSNLALLHRGMLWRYGAKCIQACRHGSRGCTCFDGLGLIQPVAASLGSTGASAAAAAGSDVLHDLCWPDKMLQRMPLQLHNTLLEGLNRQCTLMIACDRVKH